MKRAAKTAILLCTYNGEGFLDEQLKSFAQQSYRDWFLIASDDGSTDTTNKTLTSFQQGQTDNPVTVIKGPGQGFVQNFLSVTRHAAGKADYYAWSDQDDIWHADKLERALAWLKTVPDEIPALYCGRTQLVTEDNQDMGLSMLFSKKPSFANALTQNIGGGNTMVFNQAACRLLTQISNDTPIVSHDWWAYMLISGAGGKVFYDQTPCLRYRQHGNNLVGANTGWLARFVRIKGLVQGRFKNWNSMNISALEAHQSLLTEQNRQTLQRYAKARQQILPLRLIQVKRSGVYRQTLMGNLGLLFAATFKKL